jgi:GT2 family glycosyltransferase
VLTLPDTGYDIVGSAVLFNTPKKEADRTIEQFLMMSEKNNLKTHICLIDNSPSPIYATPPAHRAVSYVFSNRNLGYGRAHNIAIRASRARAQYNLIMNTDVTYHPEAVSRLKSTLDSDPTAGLAAPRTLYPNGHLQYVCRLLPTPANVFLRRFLPHSTLTKKADANYELRWWDHATPANIPFFQASFLLIRTFLCTEIDGFDERFFLYAEDIDLCRRIHEQAKTLYVPDACVTHEYRRYNRHSLRGTLYAVHSHCQYFNKWGWFFDRSRHQINSDTIRALRK